jgi:mono/diheme cytochrome c family protein
MQLSRLNAITLGLVLGIALTAPLFLTAAANAEQAEAAFKARCGECHGPRDIQYWGRQRADAAARQAWLDQFLRRHYPPPEVERAAIISYIQATITGQAAPR